MIPYSVETERAMKKFYDALSEKDKRRYAGIEAQKLGHGGIVYISEVLVCDRNTVSKGINELIELPEQSGYDKHIRKPGGGRKRYDEIYTDIDAKFLDVLKDHTAGDPMDEQVLWPDLPPP